MRSHAHVEVLGREDPLAHEWARAERFWTPLSLIAVDASALCDRYDVEIVSHWLQRVCRDVDIACRTGETSFYVILPCTNRTGAEAELARLVRARDRDLDQRGGKVGFGLAVAFDQAHSALELEMLAERDAEADRHLPESHERPTIPQLRSQTWIEPLTEAITVPHLQR